ncbi:MAG: phage portal protein [Nitrospirae bacterium]|nr:phage portal protein [Nitrospirota bacterium]
MGVQLLDHTGRPVAYQDTAHYGASRTARELASWTPSLASADADLLTELPALVARSRDLVRNNGLAAGGIQTLVDNVVGTGLRLSAKPDYLVLGKNKTWADDWARTVEAHWRTWAEGVGCDAARQLTFDGLTTLVFRTAMVSGESLALPQWLPGRSAFATAIQLVDPDRLSNPAGRLDGGALRGGIEFDDYGAPSAYWIRKSHPADVPGLLSAAEWLKVPARTPFGRPRVIHVHDKERTGQSRGKPLLAAVMRQFKMLDHYQHTELQASIVNAMIAAFMETSMGAEEIAEFFGGSLDDYVAKRNAWEVKLEGGSVLPLFPGDKIAPFTPSRPATAYADFTMATLRHIAAGLNFPYELLVKDFSQTTYSSARAALMEAWRFFQGRRRWLSVYWASPVYALWLEEAVSRGLVEAPDFYANRAAYCRARWIGPGRGWIDPVKEAQAAALRIKLGISTWQQECAEQGLDWEEVFEQLAVERQKAEELGLPLPDMTNVFAGALDTGPQQPMQEAA